MSKLAVLGAQVASAGSSIIILLRRIPLPLGKVAAKEVTIVAGDSTAHPHAKIVLHQLHHQGCSVPTSLASSLYDRLLSYVAGVSAILPIKDRPGIMVPSFSESFIACVQASMQAFFHLSIVAASYLPHNQATGTIMQVAYSVSTSRLRTEHIYFGIRVLRIAHFIVAIYVNPLVWLEDLGKLIFKAALQPPGSIDI